MYTVFDKSFQKCQGNLFPVLFLKTVMEQIKYQNKDMFCVFFGSSFMRNIYEKSQYITNHNKHFNFVIFLQNFINPLVDIKICFVVSKSKQFWTIF